MSRYRAIFFLSAAVVLFTVVFFANGCNSSRDPRAGISPGPEDHDAPKEFSQTDSGLKYRILRKTDGPKPGPTSRVIVNYHGWLNNGNVFDSSYEKGHPASFSVNKVIPGWTEGLQLIGDGGMIELEIPPHLGYGSRGAGASIPANATLHFLIELQDVGEGIVDPRKLKEKKSLFGPIDDDVPQEYSLMENGFQYRILRRSEGKRPTDYSKVRYRLRVAAGETAQTSMVLINYTDHRRVIVLGPNIARALKLIGEGGMIEMISPAGHFTKDVAGDNILNMTSKTKSHFQIELLDVGEPLPFGPIDDDSPENFTETDSGLKYRILRKSEGETPKENDTLAVHFFGWVHGGSEFENTFGREKPRELPLKEQVRGFIEGLQLIGEGGMIELIIPPHLGFGVFGSGSVPSESTIQYIIELVEIKGDTATSDKED